MSRRVKIDRCESRGLTVNIVSVKKFAF